MVIMPAKTIKDFFDDRGEEYVANLIEDRMIAAYEHGNYTERFFEAEVVNFCLYEQNVAELEDAGYSVSISNNDCLCYVDISIYP